MKGADFINLFIQEEIYLIDGELSPEKNPGHTMERKTSTSTVSKKLLVVTPKPLTKAEDDFLFKVFAAVNLERQDIQLSTEAASFNNFETAFFFGAMPQGYSPGLYQKIEIDHCTVVVVDSLQDIAQDQEKKIALWTLLKECFSPPLPSASDGAPVLVNFWQLYVPPGLVRKRQV